MKNKILSNNDDGSEVPRTKTANLKKKSKPSIIKNSNKDTNKHTNTIEKKNRSTDRLIRGH